MSWVRSQYGALGEFWRTGLRREAPRCTLTFFFLLALGLLLGLVFPRQLNSLVAGFAERIEEMGVVDGAGRLSAASLFWNNLNVCVVAAVLGLVPYVPLPAIPLGINALTLGGLLAYYVVNGVSVALYFAGLLPHAVFEIPAILLSLSVGLLLSSRSGALCRGEELAKPMMIVTLINGGRLLLLAVVPLLAAAALVEAHVTPLVLRLFLS